MKIFSLYEIYVYNKWNIYSKIYLFNKKIYIIYIYIYTYIHIYIYTLTWLLVDIAKNSFKLIILLLIDCDSNWIQIINRIINIIISDIK